jgi:GNAT superfamily N-acetyltransferase
MPGSTSVDLNAPEPGPTASVDGAVEPDNYPRELERDVTSDASTRYHLRPIRPDDAPRLAAFHLHLLPRSVFLRFFTFHPELSPKEVEHFTHVDYVDRLALVAEVDDRLIAVGRFDRSPGETEAEVAFVVSDEYQHHGIGTLLLDELAQAARDRGVTSFRAETLCENRTMLSVFRHAGFPITSSIEYGTATLRFSISPTAAYRAALAAREATRGWPAKGQASPCEIGQT